MTVTQTFTYLPNGFIFEFIKCDDGSTVCRLMPDPAAAAPVAPPPETPLLETPAPAAAPGPLTKKKRLLPALIRGTYAVIFALLGAAATALVYVEGVLGSLSLPPWVAAAVGIAVTFLGYFLKKFIKPDGLL